MTTFKALGQTVTEFEGLERIEISPAVREVVFSVDDMTSICPVTGQPDFQSVKISLFPGGHTIETKTLKLYLETFRNRGIFAEDLASTIANDVLSGSGAKRVEVELTQHTRGGMVTKVLAVVRGESS